MNSSYCTFINVCIANERARGDGGKEETLRGSRICVIWWKKKKMAHYCAAHN